MKNKTLPYPIISHFTQHISNQNLCLYIIPSLKSFIAFSLKEINFSGSSYGLSSKTNTPHHTAKTSNLELNLSLLSKKASNLYTVICSKMNNASVTYKLNTTAK